LDKKWLCDVLYSLDMHGIKQMIDHAMKLRRDKVEQSQDMIVEMKPEFAEALKKCV
jgi:hypothetical protein